MNKKLFLFSNLISISKINCIDFKKIKVFLEGEQVDTKKYIKEDKLDIDEPDDEELGVALISENEVSISKIEVELKDGSTLYFSSIGGIEDYLRSDDLKTIKIYLVNHKNCCKKFSIRIGKKCNSFNNFPFELIVYFYKLFAKDINKKDLNVDIFSSCQGELSISDYANFNETGYSYKGNPILDLDTLYIKDILIESKDKKEESIIENSDYDTKIIEKLGKLEKCNVAFIVESKKFDDKNINVHINFDDFNDKEKIISAFSTNPDEKIMYEFFNKKK